MAPLTKRQRELLDFITDTIGRQGYAPTFEEIARRFNLSSMATVHKHLMALEQKGAIRRRPGCSRGIELVQDAGAPGGARLRLMGEVAAGAPLEAIEDGRDIVVPAEFVGSERCYILRVRGDSMIEEHIRDGDLIIVDAQAKAAEGQTVVALIDGADTTVKKFHPLDDRIRLVPANRTMPALEYDAARVTIQGVVVGLLRKYGQA